MFLECIRIKFRLQFFVAVIYSLQIIYLFIFYSLIKYKYVLHKTVHELDKQGY